MIVMAEITSDPSPELEQAFKALIKSRIGVDMPVELHQPGELTKFTEVDKRQKAKRLSDERFD
jgi:phenylacetate-CoA ligase